MINSSYFNDIDMNIIKYPIITDKATRLLANNQYSFVVQNLEVYAIDLQLLI